MTTLDPFTAATDRLLGERMSKHTDEPWRIRTDRHYTAITGKVNGIPIDVVPELEEFADDARRIVACVNACAGLATGALEIISKNKERRQEIMEDVISMDRKISKLERQNAELLEALEFAADRMERENMSVPYLVREAIAKAKGEA